VNVHDFGRSAREVPVSDVPFEAEPFDRWAAIWAIRMRGIQGRERSFESMYNKCPKELAFVTESIAKKIQIKYTVLKRQERRLEVVTRRK
jgi:hypothetical protein